MTTANRYPSAGTAVASAGPPVMHTAEEAARLLKVKQSWLERQAAARKIPFSMLGGSYRFTDKHLAEIVRMNEVVPVPLAADIPPPRRPGRDRDAHTDDSPNGFERLRPRPRRVASDLNPPETRRRPPGSPGRR